MEGLYPSDWADVRYLAGQPPRFPCRNPPDGLFARDKNDLPVPQSVSDTFPPSVCFHLAGSTFNSSHSQVRRADWWSRHWSLMRGRTLTYPCSGSPAGITAGSLSSHPNNPHNAVSRPTLLFKRCFVTCICSFFCFPPAARDCVLNH